MHKKSPVEFTRKDTFVIANGGYKLKTVTIDKIKEYIQHTKEFIKLMEEIVSKNEQIFG